MWAFFCMTEHDSHLMHSISLDLDSATVSLVGILVE